MLTYKGTEDQKKSEGECKMKKIKLLVSICVAATLSLGVAYEASKIQDNNKAEVVQANNQEESLDKVVDKQDGSIKSDEKTSVDNISNNNESKNSIATENENNENKTELEQREVAKNNLGENKITETDTSCEEGTFEWAWNVVRPNKGESSNKVEKPESTVKPESTEKPESIETPESVEKPNYSESDSYIAEIEQAIFTRVNQERASNGLAPLSYNNTMQKYARIKSKDMGDRGYFDHKDPQGELITAQMKRDGVTYNAWGENIAYIQGNQSNASLANQFMDNWMNSQGHRENILSGNFTSIGIGVYKIGNTYYATQEFYR